MHSSTDPHPPAGVVELREDVPLAGRSAGARCGGGGARGGPTLIAGCFGLLSVSITIALLTQIYQGQRESAPGHGSVSSSAAECSRAGTDALQAGGRALDAAAAAALCLAVLAPHRTSLDASGSLLYWEYRKGRMQPAELVEWGGPGAADGGTERVPRLVAALAVLHARLGALSWSRVLAPAAQLARNGYNVSEGLSSALTARGQTVPAGSVRTAPLLARYLTELQQNTSAELSAVWAATSAVRMSSAASSSAGAWRVSVGGAGSVWVTRALAAALSPPAPPDADVAQGRVVSALRSLQIEDGRPPPLSTPSVASGLAVVDRLDTYAALVTGLSQPFGSGELSPGGGWRRDDPAAALDLAPAILTEQRVCGTRFVVGGESGAALAQAASALVTDGAPTAVERARVQVGADSLDAAGAAVNVVRQRGDALASHADSRGGGHASRY